jgi:putative transposase
MELTLVWTPSSALAPHDPIANLFHIPRHDVPSEHHRELRAAAMKMRSEITHLNLA